MSLCPRELCRQWRTILCGFFVITCLHSAGFKVSFVLYKRMWIFTTGPMTVVNLTKLRNDALMESEYSHIPKASASVLYYETR